MRAQIIISSACTAEYLSTCMGLLQDVNANNMTITGMTIVDKWWRHYARLSLMYR